MNLFECELEEPKKSMLSKLLGERSAALIEFESMSESNENVLESFCNNNNNNKNVEPEFKKRLTSVFGNEVSTFWYLFLCRLQAAQNVNQVFQVLEEFQKKPLFLFSWGKISDYFNFSKTIDFLLKTLDIEEINKYNFAIKHASANGQSEVVELFLNDGLGDPSDNDNYAIKWASRNGHHLVVELLLKDVRVDPRAESNATIIHASKNGHHMVVKLNLCHTHRIV